MTFESFVAFRLGWLVRIAVAMTGDAGLAEDLVQEVLVKAYQRWSRIQLLDQPETYVRRMLVNEFISWRRKWARILPADNLTLTDEEPDHAELAADRQVLDMRIRELSRREQAAVALRFYGDLEIGAIADALGCREGTVRSLLSRALAKLRIDPTLRDEFPGQATPARNGGVR